MPTLSRRLFITASVLLFVTGFSHLMSEVFRPPSDFPRSFAEAAMRQSTTAMGGMTFNLLGIFQGFSLYFAIYAMLAGAQNLMALYSASDAARTIRLFGMANTVVSAVVFAVAWHYQILPPVIGGSVLTALFGAATFLAWQRA